MPDSGETSPRLSRREFAGLFLSTALGFPILGSAPHPVAADPGARLGVRPGRAKGRPPAAGPQPLGLAEGRDGVLYVPKGYRPEAPVALVLALHGATGSGAAPARHFAPLADRMGAAILAPDSRTLTWDAIRTGFGPDREFIARALEAGWSRVQVDPSRIGVIGFSDGATYALALGRANGDLFRGIAAFSPGFLIPVEEQGRPPVFVSHGTRDHILPIDSCSRRIVRRLRQAGYSVDYREFDGDHTVPPEMAETGLGSIVRTG